MKKRWIIYFLSVIVFLGLGYVISEVLVQNDFYMLKADAVQSGHVSETVIDSGAKPQEGDCIGRVIISDIYLEYPLFRGSNEALHQFGLLNVMETGYPGSGQDVAIEGLRAGFFKKLELVKEGDLVKLELFNGNVQYTVKEIKQVPLNDETIFKDSGSNRLTLFCDYPFTPMTVPLKRHVVICEIE